MHVITHLLAGWTFAEGLEDRRDKTVVAWCSALPDLDGLGYVVDLITLHTAFPQSHYYEMFHRLWGHGMPAALVIALAVFLWRRNVWVALLGLLSVHLHLFMDVLGSGGKLSGQVWPVDYLSPLLPGAVVFEWSEQWPLAGWQNMTITLALIAFTLWRGCVTGQTALAAVSVRIDRAVVAALRARFGHPDHRS